MNLALLKKKNEFPLYILKQLETLPLDYREKHASITQSNATGEKHLEAGVVVLLLFKDSEFVFQLIRRSESVAQAGDISCPGGMLEKTTDELLCHILLEHGLLRTADQRPIDILPNRDEQSSALIKLFLVNSLREAWEEIGLSPFNVNFLGALPTYSLTFFARTIFPVVCLVQNQYEFKISSEVDRVLEIPVSMFFNPDAYAMLEIEPASGGSASRSNAQFPCLVITHADGSNDILWGATFNILTSFLKVIAADLLPANLPTRIVSKTLSPYYAFGNRH